MIRLDERGPRDPDAGDDVELVDPAGRPVGRLGKLAAHVAPGHLHRAVSVFLLDADGRVVLQQRAFSKYHSAGRWSNACCGHPRPGESPQDAARRRLAAELGIDVEAAALLAAGTVAYEVADPASTLVEREFNHVFVARSASALRPNADEVADVRAVPLASLLNGSLATDGFTAWFPIVLATAARTLVRARDDAGAS